MSVTSCSDGEVMGLGWTGHVAKMGQTIIKHIIDFVLQKSRRSFTWKPGRTLDIALRWIIGLCHYRVCELLN